MTRTLLTSSSCRLYACASAFHAEEKRAWKESTCCLTTTSCVFRFFLLVPGSSYRPVPTTITPLLVRCGMFECTAARRVCWNWNQERDRLHTQKQKLGVENTWNECQDSMQSQVRWYTHT